MTGAARQEVLRRIHEALGPDPVAEPVPRRYRTADDRDPAALRALLTDRLADYGARVIRCPADGIAAAVVDAVTAAAPNDAPVRVGVPSGFPAAWHPVDDRIGVVADRGMQAHELDALDGVITGAAVAVAETGTIVLDGSGVCGRRALTLVPDLHVCVVTDGQIVGTVPEGVARLDATRALTWISGPSATSDIELDRVEGVHGPRTLHVVLVDATPA